MKLLASAIALGSAGNVAAREVLTTSPLVVIIGFIPVILIAVYVFGILIYRWAKSRLQKKNTAALKQKNRR